MPNVSRFLFCIHNHLEIVLFDKPSVFCRKVSQQTIYICRKNPQAPVQPLLSFAPFRGITHKAYRNAFARHIGGIDTYYAPFISGTGTAQVHPAKLEDLIPISQQAAPTIPQVISNNAGEMILLGNILADRGYTELNWNLGCPFARIANKKRGCGLIPYPEIVDSILAEAVPKLHPALSVKTRLGYRHPGEIRKLLEVLNQYPIKKIIIHTRTGKQVYSGKADPAAFADCLKLSAHPLVYNGDIIHVPQLTFLQSVFPEQREWMVGRGLLINPFLALEIKGTVLTPAEKRDRLKAFHEEIWQAARERIGHETRRIGWMKAIWHYMSGMFSARDEVFFHIKRSKTDKEYLKAAEHGIQQNFADETELEAHFLKLTK
ncbi:MAG: tRNA-dihydrouridine synthase family protein [Bacteroidia bacterium]|nr:MAG: tRNA-dihydrouridine synthase family protein [Bacteroidia bacterium]